MDRRLDVLMNGPTAEFYNVGNDSSSDEEAKSSDDDIDELLKEHHESDSDSFENEMEMELNKEFLEHQKLHFKTTSGEQNTGTSSKDEASQEKDTTKNNVYDEAYFSSGSEDEDNVGGISSKSKERRTIKTDDELLYDPNMDEENENWVKEQREGHQKNETEIENLNPADDTESVAAKAKSSSKKSTCIKSANSDAILSCPACLTTLCIDCQRHDIYKQQFRAMFVMNCNIISDETLRYEAKQEKKKTGKKKQNQQQGASTLPEVPEGASASAELPEVELYQPVQCASCNTEVAVYDKEEIYHFFNVLESLS